MPQLPTPEQYWDGSSPEDNVTPELFEQSVKILMDFASVNIEQVQTREDLARVTRDVGAAVRNIVLSCGELQITNFSFIDPKTINEGNALIAAGDTTFGENVKANAEKHLTDKTMIIRTRNHDGSSTISSVSAKSLVDWYSESQTITNDRFEGKNQLTNYYGAIPINVEADRMKSYFSVLAIDFRQSPTQSYYPLKDNASAIEMQGYVGVMAQLVKELLDHLKQKKFI